MNVSRAARVLVVVLAALLVAGCAGTSSPSASDRLLTLADVTTSLTTAGVVAADVADNLNPRDGAWQCLRGSFRLARVSQQPAGVIARPGDKPGVDVLVFGSEAARVAAQASIGADGQVRTQGCAAMVEWIGKPHVLGVKNVILFVATDDPAAVTAVQAAATGLAALGS